MSDEVVVDPKIVSSTPKPFKDDPNDAKLYQTRITRFIKPDHIITIDNTTIKCNLIPISESEASTRIFLEKYGPVNCGFELVQIGRRKLLVAKDVTLKTISPAV